MALFGAPKNACKTSDKSLFDYLLPPFLPAAKHDADSSVEFTASASCPKNFVPEIIVFWGRTRTRTRWTRLMNPRVYALKIVLLRKSHELIISSRDVHLFWEMTILCNIKGDNKSVGRRGLGLCEEMVGGDDHSGSRWLLTWLVFSIWGTGRSA